MIVKILFINFCLLFVQAIELVDSECELLLPKLSFFAPIIYNETNGYLLDTEMMSNELDYTGDDQYKIVIQHDDKIILSCAPNYFKRYPNDKYLSGVCQGTNIVINGQQKNFNKDLGCEVRAIEEIVTKQLTGCPTDYTSIEYGLANPMTNKSYVLGEACYSVPIGKTQFIHTTLKRNMNQFGEIALRELSGMKYFQQIHPTSSYRIDFLHASRIDTFTEHIRSVLDIKSHHELLPNFKTLSYIDDVWFSNGQLRIILKFAWNYLTIQDSITDLFFMVKSDISMLSARRPLDIYIGGHGVSIQKSQTNKLVEMYLTDENRFPIPKFIWILIRNEHKIATFILRQGADGWQDAQEKCNSKCNHIDWMANDTKGHIIRNNNMLCCEYNEFKNIINEMPLLTNGPFSFLSDA